jgi:hypothetical protein
MAKVLLASICTLTWLARRTPYSLAFRLDSLAQSLIGLARDVTPMKRKDCNFGTPFICRAVCEDINCREQWTALSLGRMDPEEDLPCPQCNQDTGVLI